MQNDSAYNPMCLDCARLFHGCAGTTCQTWTGCAMKTVERKVTTLAPCLHFGCLGNGVTVYDVNHEEHGDYKTVAHIAECGNVKFYCALPAQDVEKVTLAALHQQKEYAQQWESWPSSRQFHEMERCMTTTQFLQSSARFFSIESGERLQALLALHAQNFGYTIPKHAPTIQK